MRFKNVRKQIFHQNKPSKNTKCLATKTKKNMETKVTISRKLQKSLCRILAHFTGLQAPLNFFMMQEHDASKVYADCIILNFLVINQPEGNCHHCRSRLTCTSA